MTNWAGTMANLLLVIGFGAMIGSLLLPSIFIHTLGALVDMLISPVSSHLPFILVLTIIATVITFYATIVQKYKMDTKLATNLNKKMIAFQKEMSEAQRSGNETRLKKLGDEQVLLLKDQSKIYVHQLKSAAYTSLVSIPLIMWVIWHLGTQPAPVTFDIPLLGTHAFTETFLFMPYWGLWLTIYSLVFGLILRKIINNDLSRSVNG